jgi:uncharacterized YigZ family protein
VPATFRTVDGRGDARIERQGSEFIGIVVPVDTVAEAEAVIAEQESTYPDATHHVPAYRVPAGEVSADQLGEVMLREWCSDDGEPSGSSGKPALNVLVQQELQNLVAVVTRYYGGTNLGVGGLARAYSEAVKRAVDDAGIVEQVPHERFEATVDYDDSGTVRGILESTDTEFEASYDEQASFEIRVAVTESAELRERLLNATSGRVELD